MNSINSTMLLDQVSASSIMDVDDDAVRDDTGHDDTGHDDTGHDDVGDEVCNKGYNIRNSPDRSNNGEQGLGQ